jgi:hypothetical protein
LQQERWFYAGQPPFFSLEVSMLEKTATVKVRRAWNDTVHTAKVPLEAVGLLHWEIVTRETALIPLQFIHGYVLCDQLLSGELAHSCDSELEEAPHTIKVCIVKKGNLYSFPVIEKLAGERFDTYAKARAASEAIHLGNWFEQMKLKPKPEREN